MFCDYLKKVKNPFDPAGLATERGNERAHKQSRFEMELLPQTKKESFH